jgi:spore coat polysaccharide biosynthesis protein SpsF
MKNTSQDNFWKGKFGDKYTDRSLFSDRTLTISKDLLSNKIKIKSCIELGANVGLNLDTLKKIYNANTFGVEINLKAFAILKEKHRAKNSSIINFNTKEKFELSFVCGVLIHQNPKNLNKIYKLLYQLSSKYIYISEYFNPIPIKLKYHSFSNKLYKRDFAKDFWRLHPKLKLINYGFHWEQDPFLNGSEADDSTWFLFKK